MRSAECTINGAKAQRDLGYEPVIGRSAGLEQLKKEGAPMAPLSEDRSERQI